MRILLVPIGSRGDVQPQLALGQGLKKRGHDVVVCTFENYAPWVESCGLRFARGGRDAQLAVKENGEKIFGFVGFVKTVRSMAQEHIDGVDAACVAHQPELIIGTSLATTLPNFAEHHGAALMWSVYFPGAWPTKHYPSPLFGLRSHRRWLNGLSWWITTQVMGTLAKGDIKPLRTKFKLGPAPAGLMSYMLANAQVLHAVDPAVVPSPDDWPVRGIDTGFWFLDDPTPLAPELEAFLNAGPPPVYIGFGSMPADDAAQRTGIIVDAIARSGVRAVLSAGWANFGNDVALPPSIKLVGATNHGLLFPRVAAVAHHCGAGTTAATLRAGVPHIPVPHGFDQPPWAELLLQLGVSAPILSKRFTADQLAAALRTATTDAALRGRAQALGERVRQTDGVGKAIEAIEAYCAQRPRSQALPQAA